LEPNVSALGAILAGDDLFFREERKPWSGPQRQETLIPNHTRYSKGGNEYGTDYQSE
jgi:hypothetical protein